LPVGVLGFPRLRVLGCQVDAGELSSWLSYSVSCFLGPMFWERGFDPGVFGHFDLAALAAQPHLNFCLFVCCQPVEGLVVCAM
jgi:hypothetical protein